jgi:trk system potassium uptake protein TrkH
MRRLAILRLSVIFTGFFSLAALFPLLIAVVFGERRMALVFAVTAGAGALAGAAAFVLGGKPSFNFTPQEGILLVCLAWFAACFLAAVPYRLSGYFPGFSDALFESVSGLTTTGSTTLRDVEILPRSLHFWRGMTHWLGGMGIVVLTVGLVPLLGVGGFQLLKAETTGPVKEKFTPRVTGTAKTLWLIYCALTALLALLLFAGGMTWFDAVFHAFSIMATGGFSTKNNSIAFYNSPYIEWVCAAFMIIAGLNFTVIYRLIQGKFREAANNDEVKSYLAVVLISALVIGVSILPQTGRAEQSIRRALFDTASIISTTGLMAEDHNFWPPLAQLVIFALLFAGGCSGSTAGGIKIIRYVVLLKQAKNEIRRLLHPSGVFPLRLDKKPGEKHAVHSIAGFFFLYFLLLCLGTLLMSVSAGAGLFDSVNASAAALGNVGLGLGRLTSGGIFSEAPSCVKWGFSFLMIAGRLELFTVLLLFMPGFWRK